MNGRETRPDGAVQATPQRGLICRAGWALIAATVLFVLIFAYLASEFGYPQVLDRAAGEVLPQLLALGLLGRAVWVAYALVPLLLIPVASGMRQLGQRSHPQLARAAAVLAVLAAASMTLGLLRWPSLHWQLAQHWAAASAASQAHMAQVFDAANLMLGRWVGEFFGELFLNLFFLASAWLLFRSPGQRLLRAAGTAAALLGLVAMLRNVLPAVEPLAAVNNAVLPLWMMVLGIALVFEGRPATRREALTC